MSPDGPDPTIATGGLAAMVHGFGYEANRAASPSGFTSLSRSGKNHSSWPIDIDVLWRQAAWHWSSCGHTRPVTSGSGLHDSSSSSASWNRPVPMSSIITGGMWILTGQPNFGGLWASRNTPSSQGASAHCLSRIASSQTIRSTSRRVNPRSM